MKKFDLMNFLVGGIEKEWGIEKKAPTVSIRQRYATTFILFVTALVVMIMSISGNC